MNIESLAIQFINARRLRREAHTNKKADDSDENYARWQRTVRAEEAAYRRLHEAVMRAGK